MAPTSLSFTLIVRTLITMSMATTNTILVLTMLVVMIWP